jgi:hypothetical protein
MAPASGIEGAKVAHGVSPEKAFDQGDVIVEVTPEVSKRAGDFPQLMGLSG